MGFNDGENVVLDALLPLSSDYGLSSFDRTHAFKVNWVYDLPKHFRSRVGSFVLNGWQMSGILSLVSGPPAAVSFTTTNGVAIKGSASQTPRRDVVGDAVLAISDRTFARNFNTGAFSLPAVGTLGNEGKFASVDQESTTWMPPW